MVRLTVITQSAQALSYIQPEDSRSGMSHVQLITQMISCVQGFFLVTRRRMKCSALEINYKDGIRKTATAERDEKVSRLYDGGGGEISCWTTNSVLFPFLK